MKIKLAAIRIQVVFRLGNSSLHGQRAGHQNTMQYNRLKYNPINKIHFKKY